MQNLLQEQGLWFEPPGWAGPVQRPGTPIGHSGHPESGQSGLRVQGRARLLCVLIGGRLASADTPDGGSIFSEEAGLEPAATAPVSGWHEQHGPPRAYMIDGQRYRQRGAELARRAQQIKAPELRLIYLGLAAGYDRLARFHERADRHASASPTEENAAEGGAGERASRDD